jgi:hypothetical protein
MSPTSMSCWMRAQPKRQLRKRLIALPRRKAVACQAAEKARGLQRIINAESAVRNTCVNDISHSFG